MPLNPVETFFKWVGEHLTPRYSAMVVLFASFMLWAPDQALRYLNLFEFAQKNRWIWSICFLVSISVLIVGVFASFGPPAKQSWDNWRQRRRIWRYLLEMPLDQLNILMKYGQEDKSTMLYDPANGAVSDLMRRGILYVPSVTGYAVWGFSIHPNAQRYLGRNFQKVLDARLNLSKP